MLETLVITIMLSYSIFYYWMTPITIGMYVESWVGVIKLDVQCNQGLLLPLFLITSAIGRLNYWWIFCQSIPCIWYYSWKPLDVFISLYVLVEYLFHDVLNRISSSLRSQELNHFPFWYNQGHFYWDS